MWRTLSLFEFYAILDENELMTLSKNGEYEFDYNFNKLLNTLNVFYVLVYFIIKNRHSI